MHTPIKLDGKKFAAELRQNCKEMIQQQGINPCLAIVSVGADPASQTYIRNKLKACEEIGVAARPVQLDPNVSEHQVIQQIRTLAEDTSVHGIILQLPLPKHLVAENILPYIPASKDVDGFRHDSLYCPCTPEGIVRLLEEYHFFLEGRNCVVIGRSKIVGEPLAKMLIDYNATVSICHSYTPRETLRYLCRNADFIFSAVGKAGFLSPWDLSFGSVLIDVGINRDIEGKLCGDFNPDCYDFSTAYTPVPGGIGPMTVAILMEHVVMAAMLAKERELND